MTTIAFIIFTSCTEAPTPIQTIAPPVSPLRKKIAPPKFEVQKGNDPLKDKSLEDICASPYLPMLKWHIPILQSSFTELCCGSTALNGREPCGMDWPFSDIPSCDAYDDLRNGIFALYGYPFKTEELSKRFTKESWYIIRTDFSESWLSAVATDNISSLLLLKKNKVACIP